MRTLTIHQTIAIVALFAASALPTYAVSAACASAATGTVLDTIDSANSGNNTSNALGCGSVDVSFDNISLSGSSASGGYTAASLTNTALFVSGGTIANNTISQMTMTVNPTSSTLWSSTYNSSTPNSAAMSFTMNYSVTAQSSGSYGSGGSTASYTQPDPGFRWYFDKISAGIAGSVTKIPGSSNPQSAVVTTTFCLGSTAIAGCAAANSGTITATIAEGSVISLACSASTTNYSCSSGTVDLINTIRISTIGLSSVVTLTRSNDASAGTVRMDSFSVNLDQVAYAPEPSTFALLGAALIALAAYAKRREV